MSRIEDKYPLGKVYYYESKTHGRGTWMIRKHIKLDETTPRVFWSDGAIIKLDDTKIFFSPSKGWVQTDHYNIREANENEIKWLEECVEAGELITRDDSQSVISKLNKLLEKHER